jgi:succinate-acetate transporter protein
MQDGNPAIRIVVQPYGSALPLGFFSFGIGMVLLGGIGVGWVHGPDVKTAGLLIALFVFPLELLAAVIAFLARDTASAAALGLFSSSWLALGLVDWTAPAPGAKSDAVGLYLVMFAVMVLALAAASFLGKPLLGVLLLIAASRSTLFGAWELGAGHHVLYAAGVVGLVLAGLSVYGGLAFLLEDLQQKTVLPLFRIRKARESIEGDLQAQLERLQGEAGVRHQL